MSATKIEQVERIASLASTPEQSAPLGWGLEIDLVHGRRCLATGSRLANGSCGVEVFIDGLQLLVIVEVWMLVAGRAIWIASVIHARSEVWVRVVLVLMIKAENMADLLTHNEPPPGWGIVAPRVEIRIIELHNTLRDVIAADPDLGYSEPAGVAVSLTADLGPPAGGSATLRFGPTRYHCGVQHARYTPVARRFAEICIPSGRYVIT